MSQLQNNVGLSFNNPTGVENLEQLNNKISKSNTYRISLRNESSRNTPIKQGELEQVYQVLGVDQNGVPLLNPVPFVTISTKQTIVDRSPASSGAVGSPSAVPIVTDNKNLNLQAGLGIDDIINVVIPYARSATIRFTANKLKPNTRYYAFFNEYNVTQFCNTGNIVANVSSFSTTTMTSKLESKRIANVNSVATANVLVAEVGNIFSDYKGFVSGVFNFNTSVGLKIPSGQIKFRLTDSPTNGEDKESFADAIYTSIGRVNRTAPPPPPPQTVAPTYGSGGTTPSRGSGKTNPSLPTPGNKVVAVDPPEDPQYGWLDHHIAYLKNIPLSSITPSLRAEFSNYYANTPTGKTLTNNATLQSVVPGAVNYSGVNNLVNSGNFNFKSGTTAPSNTKNDTLSNGSKVADYKTATNILDAKTTGGQSFVEKVEQEVKTAGGTQAWNMTLASYEGTKKATEQAVKSGNLTPEMKSFWEAGLKNGSFVNSAEGVQKAINNFAAATTLGMLTQQSAASQKASVSTINNGYSPNSTTSTTNKNNSIPTSTK